MKSCCPRVNAATACALSFERKRLIARANLVRTQQDRLDVVQEMENAGKVVSE